MAATRPREINVIDPVLLIRIDQLYRPGMSAQALYEVTRGIWKVGGARRERVKHALAVFGGIVLEVFAVNHWTPAGTSRYVTRDDISQRDLRNRWEFTGSIAPASVRSRYRGGSVAAILPARKQKSTNVLEGGRLNFCCAES